MFHKFNLAKSDGADASLVRPSNWNEAHVHALNAKSANYTATSTDDYIPVTTGSSNKTITLPSSPTTGFPVIIKKVDGGTGSVIIVGTVDGTSISLTAQYQFVVVVFNGTAWDIVGASSVAGPTGPAGNSNVPFLDAVTFGALARTIVSINDNTTAVCNGTTTVVLGNAKSFKNAAGIAIQGAGPNTTLTSAPSAPTASTIGISASGPSSSSQTIGYKIVGYDGLGGLSAASLAGTVSAPSVFAPSPVNISSISQSGNTLTINFTGPLNATVTAGMPIHLVGLGNTVASVFTPNPLLSGIWPIASAPSTSQVTVTLPTSATYTGNTGTGRVSNVALISSASLAATGVLTLNFTGAHNFLFASGVTPTVVNVENLSPAWLNGTYAIGSVPTANSLTVLTPITGVVETATIQANNVSAGTNASAATVFEEIKIACPALATYNAALGSGACVGYYIYSDWGTGTYQLIGKTFYGEVTYFDQGAFQSGGFVAPAYVSTTPPSTKVNQIFADTVVSGQGSTTLVLAHAPNQSGTFNALYDDSVAIAAAFANRTQGGVMLSPNNAVSNPYYVLNAPLTLGGGADLYLGNGIYLNETLTTNGSRLIKCPLGSATTTTQAFSGPGRYAAIIVGVASPGVLAGQAVCFDRVSVTCTGNNQVGIQLNTPAYDSLLNFSGVCSVPGNSISVLFNGQGSQILLRDTTFFASGPNGNVQALGASILTPALHGQLVFRCSDNPVSSGVGPGDILMEGNNQLNGRNCSIDFRLRTGGGVTSYTMGSEGVCWNQFQTAPTFTFFGTTFNNIKVRGCLNDTSTQACIANLTSCVGVDLWNNQNANPVNPITTGLPIVELSVRCCPGCYQTVNAVTDNFGVVSVAGNSGNQATTQAVRNVGYPIVLTGQGCVVQKIPKPTGITAVIASSGSLSQPTIFLVVVTYVDFAGNEGDQSDPISVTTSSGNQSIAVGWTLPAGMAAARVYLNGNQQASAGYTGSGTTISSFVNNGPPPQLGTAGTVSMGNGQVVSPVVRLTQGNNKTDLAASSLTAARTANLPDASGNVLVEITTGIGNGSSAAINSVAKGTGTGPATPGTIVAWAQVNIAGSLWWIPLAQ